MAKRLNDSEQWDRDWFMELKPRLKCLVRLVRDKCDFLGIWNPNWTLASRYIGEKVCEKDLLSIDRGRQFVKMADGKIYCIGFIEFHYGKISENPPQGSRLSSIHIKVLEELEKRGLKLETLKSYSKYPIDTLYDRVIKNKETEEEIKNKETETKTKTEEPAPPKKHRYQEMTESYINIPQMKTQLTYAQAVKLEVFGDAIVEDVFNNMDNKPDLTKNYFSVYLTALDWCKRRKNNTVINFNDGKRSTAHGRTVSPGNTPAAAIIPAGQDFGGEGFNGGASRANP